MTDSFVSTFQQGVKIWVEFLELAAQAGRNLANSTPAGEFTVLYVPQGKSATYDFPVGTVPPAEVTVTNFKGFGNDLVSGTHVKVNPVDGGLVRLTIEIPADQDKASYVGTIGQSSVQGSILRSFVVNVV